MQGKNPAKTPDYFDGDTYIQHNTGIADGLFGLGAALEALASANIQMIYDTVHQVLGLWRVQNGKIAEHWDVMETIADKSAWQMTTANSKRIWRQSKGKTL